MPPARTVGLASGKEIGMSFDITMSDMVRWIIMNSTGKKKGPPPFPPERKRSARVTLRLLPGERRALDAEAARRGLTISDIILERVRWGGK
jgi:hypothetical protein